MITAFKIKPFTANNKAKYTCSIKERSHGLVVRVEDSRTHNQEDVGSNPAVYWMDVSVASYYIERKTIKVAKWGTPKKTLALFLIICLF
jgi:hypothetical protein